MSLISPYKNTITKREICILNCIRRGHKPAWYIIAPKTVQQFRVLIHRVQQINFICVKSSYSMILEQNRIFPSNILRYCQVIWRTLTFCHRFTTFYWTDDAIQPAQKAPICHNIDTGLSGPFHLVKLIPWILLWEWMVTPGEFEDYSVI